MEIIRFKRCECNPDPHGYFHKDGARADAPILSVVAGKMLMERVPKAFEGQDMSDLEKQMRDAGLPEIREDGEDIFVIEESLNILTSGHQLAALITVLEALDGVLQQTQYEDTPSPKHKNQDHGIFVVNLGESGVPTSD